jgi:hypothetical protein
LKTIEHKKYTARMITRFKAGGRWVVQKFKKPRFRKFEQTIYVQRTHGPARRYLPVAESPMAPTYPQFDRTVHALIDQQAKAPHQMAKRKYHPHRPKPADNRAKNRARRHAAIYFIDESAHLEHPQAVDQAL